MTDQSQNAVEHEKQLRNRTDSKGRCLTCEGTGIYFEYSRNEAIPVDCPDCSEQTGTERGDDL